MGSLHTLYKLHVQLHKGLSCQHAFGQRCTKINGFEKTLLDGSFTPEVGIVGSLHTSDKLHVQLFRELLDLTKVLHANMLTMYKHNWGRRDLTRQFFLSRDGHVEVDQKIIGRCYMMQRVTKTVTFERVI